VTNMLIVDLPPETLLYIEAIFYDFIFMQLSLKRK